MSQTTVNTDPDIGRQGMRADSRIKEHVNSRLANGPVAAGLGVLRDAAPENTPGGSPGTVKAMVANPAALTEDVDSIAATVASAAAPQVLSGAALDGIAGDGVLVPSRLLRVVMDADTDWDPTTLVVYGMDSQGNQLREEFSIDASVDLTGALQFARVDRVEIPAQTGAGGNATIGTALVDDNSELGRFQMAGSPLYDSGREVGTQTAEYADEDNVSVLRSGAIFVNTEDAATPDDAVYCRVVAAGGEEAGAFRTDTDGNDAFVVRDMNWQRSSVAAGLNVVEFDW